MRETVLPQKPVELILLRQLASYLAMPIFLVDVAGDLLFFYNEPAERLLGRRYDELQEMPLEEWSAVLGAPSRNARPRMAPSAFADSTVSSARSR